MSIKYVSVQEILEEKEIKYPAFGVFNSRGNVIKIAQWQPLGELGFSTDKGFYCKSGKHIKKGLEFLKSAVEQNADLVITPEYSLPWEILEDILQEGTVALKNGKLLCLGMEGISFNALVDFCEKYDSKDNLCVIVDDLEDLNQKSFCSCIVYLFRSQNEIVCLIQLKTTAAADRWVELESGELTLGNTIYYFCDDRKANCLFAYICADALNQDINKVKEEINYQQCIIIHPQLNPAPLHESFCQMRRNFFDYSEHSIRMISANWSKDTELKDEGIAIQESFSAFYDNETVDMDTLTKLLTRNKSKGIDLVKQNYISIWHMPNEEHFVVYSIDEFRTHFLNRATSEHNEPISNAYFEYNETDEEWQSKSICERCSIDWEWLKKEFQLEKCNDTDCCIVKLYHFFAILFLEGTFQGLELHDGLRKIIFLKEYKNVEEIITLRERSKYINEALQSGNIPEKFSHLKEKNYVWILDKRGNLAYKDRQEGENPICIAYVDCENEDIIKRKISDFEKSMGKDILDRLLVYFLTGNGLKFYDKFYNLNINNPVMTHPSDLIKDSKR